MTIIPDDHSSSPGTDPAERPDQRIDDYGARIGEYGARVEDSTKRIAAAIAGALEGFIGALDRYEVANEGDRALQQAGAITRAAAVEGRAVGQTPEMRQVGEGLHRVGEKTSELTHRASDAVKTKAHDVRESVAHTVGDVRDRVNHAREEVKVRAEAVGETGRRARAAPRAIGHEMGEWFAAWKRGFTRSLAGMAVMGMFALMAMIVLTIALVVGLNEILGDPAGTFVVAVLYLVVAGIAFAVAKSAKTRAALEREEHMANAREEVRHVVRPVRDAFGRGRTNI